MPHRIPRTLIHSLALALINLLSIIAGFGVYSLVRSSNQVLLQVPVAMVLSIVGFAAWGRAVKLRLPRWSMPEHRTGWLRLYLGAFPLGAVIFVPLHYVMTGYLTAPGNVVGLWLFQLVANLLVILVLGWSTLLPLDRPQRDVGSAGPRSPHQHPRP